jgi:GntR family transcriptional regulator
VRESLLARIQDMPPGARLPTEPELGAAFGVSRTTIRTAVDDLARSGLVQRRAGSGTFVAEPPIEQELTRLTGFVEDMKALNRRARAVVVSRRRVPAAALVAQQLGLPPDAQVVRIERIRLANDTPISFDVTYLPTIVGDRIARENLVVDPIFELLESKYGIALGGADCQIEAANAERQIARHLQIPVNAAILRVQRTTFAATGEPVDHEVLHYRGDRLRYRLHLNR